MLCLDNVYIPVEFPVITMLPLMFTWFGDSRDSTMWPWSFVCIMVRYTKLRISKFSIDFNALETVGGSTAWLAVFLPKIETNYITQYRVMILIAQTCRKMASKKFWIFWNKNNIVACLWNALLKLRKYERNSFYNKNSRGNFWPLNFKIVHTTH